MGFIFQAIVCAWLIFAAAGAAGAVAVLPLEGPARQINLIEHMSSLRLDAQAPLDPDALWEGSVGEPIDREPRWRLRTGERIVGRITLVGTREAVSHVIEVPASSVDDVRVWQREAGGAWKSAEAGDRIALSRWPFASQYPGFPVVVRDLPVDVIVAVANSGPLRVVVSVLPDPLFRESRTRSANLSGLIMGLGAMVAIVCLLGAVTGRRRVQWLLAGVAIWTLCTAAALNGYLAVWFTSEAEVFNDSSKNFVGVVLGGLTVALIADALDPRSLRRGERMMAMGMLVVCVVWSFAQFLWLPLSWRMAGAIACALLTISMSIGLCVLSTLRGGRQAGLLGAAVACMSVAWALALVPRDFAAGLDLRAAFVGMMLYSALLLIRQALIERDRYGRDVLGRAAVSANRDPLTALLSWPGFELAYEEALLRQGAGARATSVMLFLLPGLEESGEEHGYVVTERALVRFAAALQASLGDAWSIARLSKTRFAAISTQPYDMEQVGAQATQVLARCARISQPLAPLSGFGLRIACLRRPLAHDGLPDVIREMDEAAQLMEEGKRIVFV